jgi:hypothetical protein
MYLCQLFCFDVSIRKFVGNSWEKDIRRTQKTAKKEKEDKNV